MTSRMGMRMHSSGEGVCENKGVQFQSCDNAHMWTCKFTTSKACLGLHFMYEVTNKSMFTFIIKRDYCTFFGKDGGYQFVPLSLKYVFSFGGTYVFPGVSS